MVKNTIIQSIKLFSKPIFLKITSLVLNATKKLLFDLETRKFF